MFCALVTPPSGGKSVATGKGDVTAWRASLTAATDSDQSITSSAELNCATRTRLVSPAYCKIRRCTPWLMGPLSPSAIMMECGPSGPSGTPA